MINFLMTGGVTEDEGKSRKDLLRAARFKIRSEKLYKRLFGGSLLKCVNNREAEEIMIEVHKGTYLAKQGEYTLFKAFLKEFGINDTCAVVAYPQAHRQVEDANCTILDRIKKKLDSVGRG